MISVDNIRVDFGGTNLFHDVSFIINKKDRVALVGKNGAGKTTLLRILSGTQSPTEGSISKQRNITVGYLPQVMNHTDGRTVFEEAETAFEHIHEMEARLKQMNDALAMRNDYESEEYRQLIEDYTHLNEQYNMIGGSHYEAEIERALTGLGFRRSDFSRPTNEFSGGWRMRIELAKLLLQHPDVLLLDEPTNHLDIESIQWLEQFLARSSNAVLLVSHDRAFLNAVTNRTIEISCGRIYDYKLSYDKFMEARKERREQQIRAYENQQKEIADIKEFIERFRYKPTKAVQVQSRIKQLEKMIPIEIDEEDTSRLRLRFAPATRSGNYPVTCDSVGKSFSGHTVFSNVNFTINRGEKVAFVGRNGEGKTTLVRCILQELNHDGTITIGHNVQTAYFAQHQAQLLDENLTVFQTIDNVATGDIRLRIRDILGAFMFGGEASEKPVRVLSGGERSRLAMIRLLLQQMNLLILDEPTNHLDMQSKDVLKEAIRDFDGTVIIVSHDRHFLDGLVTKVYEFADGKVREHLGGIYDYLATKNADNINEALSLHKNATGNTNTSIVTKPAASESRLSYEAEKQMQKQRRKMERLVEQSEQAVNEISSAIAALEALMSTPEGSTQANFERYASLKQQLSTAETEWEQNMEALENLQ
ncbi:MAG: ABC-F family ATP-binding cassette domain-containing protein [Bacteroidaceae bacterium]|nr:ABC-F family ATP-binding cassette domain-containing protein [Bacteroidaceae bacterium]